MNSPHLYNEHAAHYRYANQQLGMCPLDASEFADHMMEDTGFMGGDWVANMNADLHEAADEARMERELGFDPHEALPLPDVPQYLLDEYYEDLDLLTADAAWYGEES